MIGRMVAAFSVTLLFLVAVSRQPSADDARAEEHARLARGEAPPGLAEGGRDSIQIAVEGD